MVAGPSFLCLKRLRVLYRGDVAYDQAFHQGVNIIRGQNGSGKSTIADFIFFVLGGEFDEWKAAASRCDEVQAELDTPRGTLTLRRQILKSQEPLQVYFGPMSAASESSLEGWERFPIRRHGGRESFSQVMFRSLLIPEAPSEAAANITMHQLLRLCYADQRTPSFRLFRLEPFDTQNIREAVGDLICGVNGYELYEIALKLRDLNKRKDEIAAYLKTLHGMLPLNPALDTPQLIQAEIARLEDESASLKADVDNIDELIELGEVNDYLAQRRKAQESLAKQARNLREIESQEQTLKFERREIGAFLGFLDTLQDKLTLAEATFNAVGSIEFTRCPGCGGSLDPDTPTNLCIVCKSPLNVETERARYNRIRLDLEIQSRESRQLTDRKEIELKNIRQELRVCRREHKKTLLAFDLEYANRNGPRERFLAIRINRIGQIGVEVDFLLRSLSTAEDISRLTSESVSVIEEIESLTARGEILRRAATERRPVALSLISDIGAKILRDDLPRQRAFETADNLAISFQNDAVSVGGLVNFAESSNVILKNTAVLSLFLAACADAHFFHPRFLLIDNIEDKGMEQQRSHLFQHTIVDRTADLKSPHQIIFATSMMNPGLELDDYTIGPAYTRGRRSLSLD